LIISIIFITAFTSCGSMFDDWINVSPSIERPLVWSFVDNDTLNVGAANAFVPTLAVSNGHLYAAWVEGAAGDIYVKRYNGNDDNPSWDLVGSGFIAPSSYPVLKEYNGKLFLAFDDGGDVFIYEYDEGTTWNQHNGGAIDYIIGNDAINPDLVIYNSILYAVWQEDNTPISIRMKKYDGGTSWVQGDIDGGDDFIDGIANDCSYPKLAVSWPYLYVVFIEDAAPNSAKVRRFDGSAWSTVKDGGDAFINYDLSANSSSFSIINYFGRIYVSWTEDNIPPYRLCVRMFDGNNWNWVDGDDPNGIKYSSDSSRQPISVDLSIVNNKLYAVWQEQDSGAIYQIRASIYNGFDFAPGWSFIDGNSATGLNDDTGTSAREPQTISYNSKIYVIFREAFGGFQQTRVIVGR